MLKIKFQPIYCLFVINHVICKFLTALVQKIFLWSYYDIFIKFSELSQIKYKFLLRVIAKAKKNFKVLKFIKREREKEREMK